MKKSLLAFLLACWFPFLCLPEAKPAVLVNSSHSGAVTDLFFDAERNLLFSAGEDGTVRIWDAGTGRLKDLLRISNRPLQRLAVNPRLPQVAALLGDNLRTDTLVVWDWEKGGKLFSMESPQQLLYLAYSPQGTYLLYSKADFESLVALDPQTGRSVSFLRKGFGIVSFFAISKTETNIMSYQPSGLITYWNIRREEKLRQFRTLPDLSLIRITPNSRFIMASAQERLVAVDLLNGTVTAEEPAPGLVRTAVSPSGNEVATIAESSAGTVLKQWYFSGRSLLGLRTAPGSEERLGTLIYGQAGLFAAGRAGTLYRLASGEALEVFARNNYLPISDLAFWGGSVAVGNPERILVFAADFFARPDASDRYGEVSQASYPNPFSRPAGLVYLDGRRLLLWPRDEGVGELALLDPATGESRRLEVPFSSAIQQGTLSPRGIIVVERGGLCRILDKNTFQVLFQYVTAAMNRLVFTHGDVLVGGASSASAFGSPLLQIDLKTGETVPIPDSSLFIYDLLYHEASRTLFSLAVERSKDRTRTLFKQHFGSGFEKSRVITAFEGEDLSAVLAADASGRVYSSLGYGAITVWREGRLSALETSGRVPRQLHVWAGKLFALNGDSSITVWELESMRIQFEIHLFRDGSWAAVSPEGWYYRSEGARKYLTQS